MNCQTPTREFGGLVRAPGGSRTRPPTPGSAEAAAAPAAGAIEMTRDTALCTLHHDSIRPDGAGLKAWSAQRARPTSCRNRVRGLARRGAARLFGQRAAGEAPRWMDVVGEDAGLHSRITTHDPFHLLGARIEDRDPDDAAPIRDRAHD